MSPVYLLHYEAMPVKNNGTVEVALIFADACLKEETMDGELRKASAATIENSVKTPR